uniref:Golgin subfamily A conserved domain-containing protein n=1 Tax=Colobus angolensis palliatus TaxID=336983 RepID=A0A2K5IGR0_COLAP
MLPVDVNERKSEGLDTEGKRISPCIHGVGPTSSATLKDLEVEGSGRRCSDHAGQPSNLLPQRGLGAPLPAESVHTHPSPNDCSLPLPPLLLHLLLSACASEPVSVKISRLNNTIKSLEQQKKHVEHQLEEEKKANNEKEKTERELEAQIQRLNIQKKKLTIDLYHTKRSLIYFEEESKDLAGRLQCSSQCTEKLERALSAVTATQKKKSSKRSKTLLKTQLEQSLKECEQLKAHTTQMKESLQKVQLERDEYAERIKGKRARWQERMRQMSQELWTLKKEKQHNMHRVEELERSLSTLKNQMVSAELQAQVENHQHISLLNQAQKERLREQEERLRRQEERLQEQQERLQQLAEPQSGIEELNNENKSALHLEQQVEELQQKLHEVNETVTSTHKEPEAAVPAPGTGGESRGLMDLLEEKADLRERMEKLEHQFIQYCRERWHQKIKHLVTEPEGSAKEATPGGGHHQAGPGRRNEAPGAAGGAVAAWVDGNKGHSKFLAAAQNPADEPGPGAPPPQELGAADQHG